MDMPDKKRRGRPFRAPGEQMYKLGVTVRKRMRDILEIIARDRRTSVSQALEYVIDEFSKTYKIGEYPLRSLVVTMDALDSLPGMLEGSDIDWANLANMSRVLDSKAKAATKFAGKAFDMPAPLLKPGERLFLEVFQIIGDYPTEAKPLDNLYQVCELAEQLGYTPDDIVIAWQSFVKSLQQKGQPKP